MGKIFLIRLCLLLSLASPVGAEQATPDLRGIGLLERGEGGCTGTLIEPDLVLTAAHCLIGARRMLQASDFRFHPTLATGRPGIGFRGKAMAVHPVYLLPGLAANHRIPRDLGLLRLEEPVPGDLATPIPPGGADLFEDRGFIMAFRGPDSTARQRICQPIGLENGLLMLGCEVQSGESGSPFFVVRDGAASVVSVVSSRTSSGRQPLAMTAELANGLPPLLEAFRMMGEATD